MISSIPRIVWLLGLISFINDASSEMIYPLIPLYLSSVLLAGPHILGIIEGIVEALGSLLKLVSGILSDKIKASKGLVVAGYMLSNLIKPLLGLVTIWPLILLLRTMDKIGKGLRTAPRDALLASSITIDIRGKAFGLQRAMDNAGGVVGPLFAALLLSFGLSYQEVFFWTIVPGGLCVALTLGIREPTKMAQKPPTAFKWKFKQLPVSFKRYLIIIGLFSLGNSSNMFLLLRAKEMGLSDNQIPLLWALTAVSASIFSVPLSALSDKLGRKTLIISGWLIYGIFYFMLSIQTLNLTLLWPLFAVYGLFLAATEGAERAFVADLAQPEQLGTAYGWFNMISGILLLPASLLFGFLWEKLFPELAFGIAALLAFLSAGLLKLWLKN